MPRQLFGTDGVRGRAGDFLTADLALALARAAVAQAPQEHPRVLIVRDTRESGEMLESAIAAGVTAAGGDALLAGVLPTPAEVQARETGVQLAEIVLERAVQAAHPADPGGRDDRLVEFGLDRVLLVVIELEPVGGE